MYGYLAFNFTTQYSADCPRLSNESIPHCISCPINVDIISPSFFLRHLALRFTNGKFIKIHARNDTSYAIQNQVKEKVKEMDTDLGVNTRLLWTTGDIGGVSFLASKARM